MVIVLSLLACACGSQATPRAAPEVRVPLGQRVNVASGQQDDGFAAVTVYSLQDPAVSGHPSTGPDSGDQLAVADVEVCGGPHGANSNNPHQFLPFPFGLTLSNGTTESMLQDPTLHPQAIFVVAAQLRPNQCARGFAPFEHQRGLTVTGVSYGDPTAPSYLWTLPPGTTP